MYKIASKMQLRFTTSKGLLSTEQLWDLSQNEIANSLKAVKKILKKTDDDELSFLEDNKVTDIENELRFNILKDVYMTKKQTAEEIRNVAVTKAHNQRIDELIARKNDEKLESMSVEDLEKLRK